MTAPGPGGAAVTATGGIDVFTPRRGLPWKPRNPARYGRAVHPEGGLSAATATPPPALAYWLPAEVWTAVRAAAQRTLDAPGASPALRAALTELDAAAIRSRWFDHPAAATFRRVAGHDPNAVTVRLTAAERDALIGCDPDLVTPLLEDDTRPTRPAAAARNDQREVTAPAPPRPAGPVIVLDDTTGNLRWAVAEFDGITITVGTPSPAATIWTRACEATQREAIDVDAVAGGRRLVAHAHPGLSTLALARPEYRPAAGETVLLRLPDTVVIAPGSIASRVAAYAAPIPVTSVPAEQLPVQPAPASTLL